MTGPSDAPSAGGSDPARIRAWERELDAIEADVAATLAATSREQLAERVVWEPDESLGPLPPELEHRARRVLEKTREAEQAAARHLQALRAERDDLTQRRAAGQAYADTSTTM